LNRFQKLRAYLPLSLLAAALVFGALWLGADLGHLYSMPALVVAVLLLIGFGRTLLPGQEPLITTLAAERHGPLDAATVRYTRRVTQMWTVFFGLMIAEILLLPHLAPPRVRPVFAYGVNYLVIVALFLGEFWLRRRFLPQVEHPSLGEYLRYLRNLPLHRLWGKRP
jgi:uncharacterized membrane protein